MEAAQYLLIALQAVGAAFCTVIWFNYQDLKQKTEAVARELAEHKLHVAERYPTQDFLSRTVDALFKKLDTIEHKLDTKQDKPPR